METYTQNIKQELVERGWLGRPHKIVIDADKLYNEGAPCLGHSEPDAFAELIDNSFDARASEITIILEKDKITIIDDGNGMTPPELINSASFSSATANNAILGRFGAGGTAASCLLGDEKLVLTKTSDGDLLCAKQSLVKNVDKIEALPTTAGQQAKFKKLCGDSGTIIIITCLKDSKYGRQGDLKNVLLDKMGLTFRNYLDGGKRIYIKRKGKKEDVRPYDPLFYNDEKKTISCYSDTLEHKGELISLRFSILDHTGFINGDKGQPSQRSQGVHFCRNGREVDHKSHWAPVGWHRHNRNNCGKVDINFPSALDNDFGVKLQKNKVEPSQSLSDKLQMLIAPFLREVQGNYKKACASGEVVGELVKEEDRFNKNLANSGSSLGLSRKNSSSGTTRRREKGNREGTVLKKGTGIKRRPPTENYVLPKWDHAYDPHNPRAYWFDVEEGKMTITLNDAHPLIRDLYLKGDEKTKELMRCQLAAACITLSHYAAGTSEHAVAEDYQEKYTHMFIKMHKHILS